jgi:hypothetical protein
MRRLIVIALFVFVAVAAAGPRDAYHDDVRGVALGLFASDINYDYETLVREIGARGASDVMVVVQLFQRDSTSALVARGTGTASNAVLSRTIRQVRERGMRATVMPIVRLQHREPHQWRGNIDPPVDPWFRSYGDLVTELARVSQAAGADRFVVGSELGSMQQHEGAWRALVEDVRTEFGGRVVYSANWDNYQSVPFWDAVDDVGVTGYFPISHGESPTLDELRVGWREHAAELERLGRVVGRPVIVTEVGYPSHAEAAAAPWDQFASVRSDPALQARLYRAFCDSVESMNVDGYYFWNWFGVGGPREVSYTPRGKPAAAELQRCFTPGNQ